MKRFERKSLNAIFQAKFLIGAGASGQFQNGFLILVKIFITPP
jgi:hypothetical protein